ncbi:hypothetical protein MKW92_005328 [Papaver armeniacum]|nr:hypothetical protein MKW92_005328 [Papaver armeniacum]
MEEQMVLLEAQYFHDHAIVTPAVGLNQQCEQMNAPDPIRQVCSKGRKVFNSFSFCS